MPRPNFFCNLEALDCILGMEFDREYPEIDLTLDIIELPRVLIFTSDEKSWTLRVMKRGEIYDHTESGFQNCCAVIDKASGEGQVEARFNEDDAYDNFTRENLTVLLSVCRQISSYCGAHDLEKLYRDLDPEQAGKAATRWEFSRFCE